MSEWHRSASGFWVPGASSAHGAPHVVTAAPDMTTVEVNSSPSNRMLVRWTAVQALATLLAVFVGVVGGAIAFVTFSAQQEINKSQQEVNEIEQQRFQRRYASRIAWWDTEMEPRPGSRITSPIWDQLTPSRILIQNRAPVPLNGVALDASVDLGRETQGILIYASTSGAFRAVISLGTIPPCSLVAFNLPPYPLYRNVKSGTNKIQRLEVEGLLFTDPVTTWSKGRTGPVEEAVTPHSIELLGRHQHGPKGFVVAYKNIDPARPRTFDESMSWVSLHTTTMADCGEG